MCEIVRIHLSRREPGQEIMLPIYTLHPIEHQHRNVLIWRCIFRLRRGKLLGFTPQYMGEPKAIIKYGS